jgi:hypothetical protein
MVHLENASRSSPTTSVFPADFGRKFVRRSEFPRPTEAILSKNNRAFNVNIDARDFAPAGQRAIRPR